MSRRIYTLLTHAKVRDHSWSIHRPGCRDITRDQTEHSSVVEESVEIDLDDEDSMVAAIDVDGLGYTAMDIKVHDCARQAARATTSAEGR